MTHAEQRRGKIGASDFATIVNGRLPAWRFLAARIMAERAGGSVALDEDRPDGPATAWGKSYEAEARNAARFALRDLGVMIAANVGFVSAEPVLGPEFADVGCSPDGLIAHPHKLGRWECGVEIKCPYDASRHAEYIALGPPAIYRWQLQGSMWVTGLDLWLFVSYDPRARGGAGDVYVSHVTRDQAAVEKLERKVRAFLEYLEGGAKPTFDVTRDAVPQLF